jgi:hypothetical protein
MFNQGPQFYNNNIHLPRANSERGYTFDQQEELLKCEEDPAYFAETYFKIIHPDHGLIPLKLFEYQREAILKASTGLFTILNQSRQSGKTTVVTAILLHAAIFLKNKRIGVLANKLETAIEIMERIKLAFEHLPDWLKPGVVKWNAKSIKFDNGSEIICSASQGNSIRGKTLYMLYIDEVAFIDDWKKFSSAVLPVIASGKTTRKIYSSTPNGMNHFYTQVKTARKKSSSIEIVEVPWWKVPGRDDEWAKKTLEEECNGDQRVFDQEYALSFHGSSSTLISGSALGRIESGTLIHYDAHTNQYETPFLPDGSRNNHIYVMTVDVSRGKGLDYSALSIIDVSEKPFKQVLTYRNNMINAVDFAMVCHKFATIYNDAYILCELNDNGEEVANNLFELESNLVHTKTKGRNGKQISYEGDSDKGLKTSHQTKINGCHFLKVLIEQEQLITQCPETNSELKTFSLKGKSYEAETGKNDDLAMTLVLFAWLCWVKFIDQITDKEIAEAIREQTEEAVERSLLPFGIVQDGFELEDNSFSF